MSTFYSDVVIMEHDGLDQEVFQDHARPSTSRANTATTGASASSRSAATPTSTDSASRILCPVDGCPEASLSSGRFYYTFTSIKNHLNGHCTGYLSGAIPTSFLRYHKYTQCSVCDRLLSIRYKGTCQRCRPGLRAQEQMNIIRTQSNSQGNNSSDSFQTLHITDNLPSLAAVFDKFVPTIKNVPAKLRRLWSQCLAKSLAQVVWSNNLASWTELLMLPKCTLCRPVRGGKSHAKYKVAWTQGRLQRWIAGERSQLW